MKKIMKLTLGLMLLMLPVTGCSASPQASAESSGPVTLRVGTWNIAAKNHPDTQAMAELFAQHHLDAVGIQEVDAPYPARYSKNTSPLNFLRLV